MNEILSNAREMRTEVEKLCSASKEKLPREVINLFSENKLLGLSAPKAVGGSELALADQAETIAQISYADPSAGWVLLASSLTAAFFGAFSPDDFAEDLFANGIPTTAGQFAPNGTAVKQPDGWLLNGNYEFGSGIAHAQWVGGGVITQPEDNSEPKYLFALFPATEAIEKGNWDVLGLRATQSYDYEISDLLVPEIATFDFFAPTRHRGGEIYDIGVIPLTAVGHAGWALGVGRRALDELRDLAVTKVRMGAASSLKDSERFKHELGTLESRFRSARAWLLETCDAVQAQVETEETPDPTLGNELRQATVFLTQETGDIVRQCYLLGGTTSLRSGPIEKCFRDIHAGTQHFFASPASTQDFATDLLTETEKES